MPGRWLTGWVWVWVTADVLFWILPCSTCELLLPAWFKVHVCMYACMHVCMYVSSMNDMTKTKTTNPNLLTLREENMQQISTILHHSFSIYIVFHHFGWFQLLGIWHCTMSGMCLLLYFWRKHTMNMLLTLTPWSLVFVICALDFFPHLICMNARLEERPRWLPAERLGIIFWNAHLHIYILVSKKQLFAEKSA